MPKPIFGGKSPKPIPWRPLPHMEEWIENLTLDGKTPTYANSCRIGLAHFALFCEGEGVKHPDEIRRHHLLRFQGHLAEKTKPSGEKYALSTRRQNMKYLRGWINWLIDLDYITENPWIKIRIGHSAKVPKPLEDDEISALFDAHRKMAFSMSPFYYHRRETILVLLYGWGLRLHELASINVSHMDMRLDFVSVKNKGGGTKSLPYNDEIKGVTQRWLFQRGSKAVPEVDSLLIDKSGQQLSNQMIYKIVTELGVRAGVTINPHRLRDSFGTKLLESDVPVERIMKMMGHTQQAQTLSYSRVNDQTLKTSHDAVMGPLLNHLLNHQPEPEITPEAEEAEMRAKIEEILTWMKRNE